MSNSTPDHQSVRLDYESPHRRQTSRPTLALCALVVVLLGLAGAVAAMALAVGWPPSRANAGFGLLVGGAIGAVSSIIAAVAAADVRRARVVMLLVVATVADALASYCVWAWCSRAAAV